MKLDTEEKNIKIAEICGWKAPFQHEWLKEYEKEGGDLCAFAGTDPSGNREPVPDYVNDLNAMHEAEKVLCENKQIDYLKNIVKIMGNTKRDPAFATAVQRAEAFALTLGLWEEGG